MKKYISFFFQSLKLEEKGKGKRAMFPLIKASRQQPKISADKMTPNGDMKPIVTPLTLYREKVPRT